MKLNKNVRAFSQIEENIATSYENLPIKRKVIENQLILAIRNITKRAIDIIGAIFGVLFLIPLTIFIYIANLINNDKGPVFYTQTEYWAISTFANYNNSFAVREVA